MNSRLLLFLLIVTTASLHGRVWTTAENKTFEAEYVRATATSVTVKVPDGRIVPVELRLLGQADRKFVAEQLAGVTLPAASAPSTAAAPAAPSGPVSPVAATPKPFGAAALSTAKKGPYGDYLVNDWKQFEGKGN